MSNTGQKKIAVLFHANLEDRKGQTNATLSRIKFLKKYLPDGISLDAFCTSYYDGKLLSIIRKKRKGTRGPHTTIDGVNIDVLWRKFSIVDYFLRFKLHKAPFFAEKQIKALCRRFKTYDLISAHSFLAGEIALDIFKKYNIPYCITWHGSDIHSMPFESEYMFSRIKEIIENAENNFFVSSALLRKSDEITLQGKKSILYNGVSPIFHTLPDAERARFRSKYSLSSAKKIVAFVGNLLPVKNATLLPDIFNCIRKDSPSDIEFWIIGDGPLKDNVMQRINQMNLTGVTKFFGNVPHPQMPELMNCIDLLILPSANEGLPLVTVEALNCGAMAVGSDVGGIAESIGKDNVVSLGPGFVTAFSKKCVLALNGHYEYIPNSELDWDKTAQLECGFYSNILQII